MTRCPACLTHSRAGEEVHAQGCPRAFPCKSCAAKDAVIKSARLELKEQDKEIRRLREALSCNAKNCGELGHLHDGDCSDCPQAIIRARAGLKG